MGIMKKILLLCLVLIMIVGCSEKKEAGPIVEEFVGHNVRDVYDWCATLDEQYACEVSYLENSDYQKDIVFEQSVKAGNRLKDETIYFNVSNGNTGEVVLPYITPDVTKSDIEVWKKATDMKFLYYAYKISDTVEKNHVISIEPSANVTKMTPVTVYLSSGKAEPVNTTIEIEFGDFIGLSVAELEKKAKGMGLVPNHQEKRDKHDANVKIGDVAWHGSGIYEKGEVFNYGVCINAITVNPGDFVGKSEEDFIKTVKKLTLKPVHKSDRDAYSASVDMGNVVTHGNGVYVEGEEIKYGLSYGPALVQKGYEGATEEAFLNYLSRLTLKDDRKTHHSQETPAGLIMSYNYGKYSTGDYVTYYVSLGPEDVYVDVPDFSGKEESKLLDFYAANGILVGKRSEENSLLPKGTIVSNDSGKIKAGSKAKYTVSLGPVVSENLTLESFNDLYDHVSSPGDYERAEWTMKKYLYGTGFINYDVVPVAYGNYEPGILVSVLIDNTTSLGDKPLSVPYDAYIQCLITADID